MLDRALVLGQIDHSDLFDHIFEDGDELDAWFESLSPGSRAATELVVGRGTASGSPSGIARGPRSATGE
jgi:hypothetical protein